MVKVTLLLKFTFGMVYQMRVIKPRVPKVFNHGEGERCTILNSRMPLKLFNIIEMALTRCYSIIVILIKLELSTHFLRLPSSFYLFPIFHECLQNFGYIFFGVIYLPVGTLYWHVIETKLFMKTKKYEICASPDWSNLGKRNEDIVLQKWEHLCEKHFSKFDYYCF